MDQRAQVLDVWMKVWDGGTGVPSRVSETTCSVPIAKLLTESEPLP